MFRNTYHSFPPFTASVRITLHYETLPATGLKTHYECAWSARSTHGRSIRLIQCSNTMASVQYDSQGYRHSSDRLSPSDKAIIYYNRQVSHLRDVASAIVPDYRSGYPLSAAICQIHTLKPSHNPMEYAKFHSYISRQLCFRYISFNLMGSCMLL